MPQAAAAAAVQTELLLLLLLFFPKSRRAAASSSPSICEMYMFKSGLCCWAATTLTQGRGGARREAGVGGGRAARPPIVEVCPLIGF